MNVPTERPRDERAEGAILGAVLLDPAIMSELTGVLSPNDFYSPAHELIFIACSSLYEENTPIDLITLSENLEASKKLKQAGGRKYLSQLAQNVVTTHNVPTYVETIVGHANRRKIIETAEALLVRAADVSLPIDEVVASAEESLFGIARHKSAYKPAVHVKDLAVPVMMRIEAAHERKASEIGLQTGFIALDWVLTGLRPTELILLAARPGLGKSALAVNVAANMGFQGIPVGIFSLEMSDEALVYRDLCARAGIDSDKARKGRLEQADWEAALNAGGTFEGTPIYIYDKANINPLELRSEARRMKLKHDIKIIFVDYLQLMKAQHRHDHREREVSEISNSLKSLAKELHIPVVVLCQLNRKVEERADKRPILSDLRESGSLEQDADVVIFIYNQDINSPMDATEAQLIVAKHRHGPTGVATVRYIKSRTKFENMQYHGDE